MTLPQRNRPCFVPRRRRPHCRRHNGRRQSNLAALGDARRRRVSPAMSQREAKASVVALRRRPRFETRAATERRIVRERRRTCSAIRSGQLVRNALYGQDDWAPAWRSPEPRAALRGGHRRRRRPRARDRLLSGQGARHHRRRGAREGLDRRRQHRAQHHDHPLQLPVGRERRDLRPRSQALGRAEPGAELQRDVQPARRAAPGALRCTS